ncbi:putative tail fiber protein [Salmonella phage SP4 SHa-2019]|uniref:Tail fiber protein n=1 Tax=Salmonella phage SEP1 TaxID=2799685 RepID=A0AAE7S6G5_9CAUD|nr:putative tail fiber protein [Salmonella phage SP4 SHa-2019]QXN67034.1 putative tail fiber protein [Salmonella phage SEP1]QXN67190.1 putative tail fiber protein [Salmonella phage SP2 SHa-2019]
MADYKLSELNSIDTIRSDDLLHVRVKKRPGMLGDEDRRMTYQDFLASFKLERFVQIAGSTMTGDLGIVKLLYGGKAVFDPTGSSEINIGDVLKAFKINANGLKLTIADASRSATVYHTLNKPSPNELGMRTNEENDARYARLAVTNTFFGTQNIQGDANLLRLRNQNANNAQFIEGVNLDGSARWWVGIGSNDSDEVKLYNNKYNSSLTVASNISVNKSLAITGQVQPSDFSNLDARYFTQTVANQRFAQLAGDNTFSGTNTFKKDVIFNSDVPVVLKNLTANKPLYIQGKDYQNTNLWFVGKGGSGTEVKLYNYVSDTVLELSETARFNKTLRITGQVQPSDWTNIDSRYIPAATLSTIARTNATNTFSAQQVINSDGEALVLRAKTTSSLIIRAKDTDGASKWFVGNGDAGDALGLYNYRTAKGLTIDSVFRMNANLSITGQVQPSDFSNLDARFLKVSGSTATNLVITETGHGLSTGRNFGIDTRDAFNRVCGWSAMTRVSNIPNYPLGPNAYMFVFGKRDTSAPGQVALHTSYNSSGLYLSRCQTQSDEVMFEKIYTDKTKPTPSELGAYTKAETDQKIATAITNSTDLNKIYPVGIVTWFNSNVNPNTALPGLTWTYLNNGVGRTIRIAAANGSDVATTGGSDSVTLAVGNLPSHTHSFSATTSSFDYGTKTVSTFNHGTKTTNNTGAHTHTVGGRYGGDSIGGKQRVQVSGTNQVSSSAGAHAHTVDIGQHNHTVGIGAHSHTVSGNTGSTGSGSAFSVTNQFYKLMAWVRTA